MRVALACVLYRRPDLLILDEVRCDEMRSRVDGWIGGLIGGLMHSGDHHQYRMYAIMMASLHHRLF